MSEWECLHLHTFVSNKSNTVSLFYFSILVEQWIKAKYLRQEFIYRKSQTYLGGTMEGYLWKRGKNDPRFQPRKFVLSENEGSLKYFLKEVNFH